MATIARVVAPAPPTGAVATITVALSAPIPKRDVCNPHGAYTTLRGMPPFQAASFNRLAYNPANTYALPEEANGNPKAFNYGTDYAAVPYDGYGIQTTATVNRKTSYPDVEWCTDNTYTNCVRNDNYILPGTIGGTSTTRCNTRPRPPARQFRHRHGHPPTVTRAQRRPFLLCRRSRRVLHCGRPQDLSGRNRRDHQPPLSGAAALVRFRGIDQLPGDRQYDLQLPALSDGHHLTGEYWRGERGADSIADVPRANSTPMQRAAMLPRTRKLWLPTLP